MLEKLLRSTRSRLVLTVFGVALLFSARHAAAAEPLVVEAIVSAPIATVWQGFASREGYASVGIPHAEIDLKVGGLLRVQPKAEGSLGDADATVSEILSFEPEHLLSVRVKQPPSGFADARAFANTWSIVYFTPLGPDMTHVRIAGFGFTEGAASSELATFFEQDQVAQLRRLEKHYWPLCELCKKEGK